MVLRKLLKTSNTINGRVEFDELGKVTRIAYSKGVKAGINLALKGVS